MIKVITIIIINIFLIISHLISGRILYHMKIILINLLFMTLLLADVKVGERFPTLALLNQHNEKIEIPQKGEVILLLSFEKEISTDIQIFLEKQDNHFLMNHHMVYISDISSLPRFLVNLFVLPKLKEFDFKVALLYDENGLNREEKKATIIYLKDNTITDIDFIEVNKLENFMVKPTSS